MSQISPIPVVIVVDPQNVVLTSDTEELLLHRSARTRLYNVASPGMVLTRL